MTDDTVEAPTSVILTFSYDRDEVLPIIQWELWTGCLRRTIASVVPAVVLGVLLLVSGAHGNKVFTGAGIALVVFSVVSFVMLPWTIGKAAAAAWKVMATTGRRTVTVTERDVEVATEETLVRTRWSFYTVTVLRDDVYLLRHTHGKQLVSHVRIPRRAFTAVADEHAFRRWAVAHTRTTFGEWID